MQSPSSCLSILLLLFSAAGCGRLLGHAPVNYQTVAADPHHDTDEAIKATQRAAKILSKGKLDAAEQTLQKALIADVTYGPAHNNLGKIYFAQRKYYLAAWEFEYAAKLMPERAEPHNNLGMVYEAVGRFDHAIVEYSNAMSLAPQNPEFIGNLARAKLQQDKHDPDTHGLLSELLLYDTRPQWVAWAREQLAVGKLVEGQVLQEEVPALDLPNPVEATEMLPTEDSLKLPDSVRATE